MGVTKQVGGNDARSCRSFLSLRSDLDQYRQQKLLFAPGFDNMDNIKVPIAANYKGVSLQNTSKSHSYHIKIWRYL